MFHLRSLPTLFVALLFFYFKHSYAVPLVDTIPGLSRMDSSVHFLVVGDWGTQGSATQRKVAEAMAAAARQLNISFVIATGDNFYPAGVNSINDSQWVHTFENVYADSSLQCRWLAVLGNHDYTLDPDAQVNYTYISTRWYMPQRYYDTSIIIGQDSMLMVFLDTEPIEKQLRGIPADTNKYSTSYVDEQLAWFKKTLSSSSAKWKIVTGHHPLHTGGSRRHNIRVKKLRRLIQPVLYANNVNFYLSGHEHHLELLKRKRRPTHYIISGAGSDTRHVGWLKRYRRFAARKIGFIAISVSPRGCLVQFVTDEQKVVYKHQLATPK
ncbi:metallophosphoesterase [Terrimonas pollutisoli]|uniref:metallophosphoesterase n=1 Tax=Terrimonas pollutisoli TaxID=3034147 RepID=UPI0023EC18C4|nr:metallophosphoesterase [Terrimonas sp. H1YJ31]